MKYLVISDIHGIYEYAKLIPDIFNREECNKLILLGDLLYSGYMRESRDDVINILNSMSKNIIAIRGNNDTSMDALELNFELNLSFRLILSNKVFLFTHGHMINEYNLSDYTDIIVLGHSHKHEIRKKGNLIIANPGSISLPRGSTHHSYMVIDDTSIIIKDIDGNIIDSIKYI